MIENSKSPMCAACLILGLGPAARAAEGDLDTSFGSQGLVRTDVEASFQESGELHAIAMFANANRLNRCAIILPCHRVIGSDGTLTGYAGGLWRKQWLLDHEKRHTGQTLL